MEETNRHIQTLPKEPDTQLEKQLKGTIISGMGGLALGVAYYYAKNELGIENLSPPEINLKNAALYFGTTTGAYTASYVCKELVKDELKRFGKDIGEPGSIKDFGQGLVNTVYNSTIGLSLLASFNALQIIKPNELQILMSNSALFAMGAKNIRDGGQFIYDKSIKKFVEPLMQKVEDKIGKYFTPDNIVTMFEKVEKCVDNITNKFLK